VSRRHEGAYTIPENLGYPLNTSSDDFSLVLDNGARRGLFASNRPGGVGYDDIYNFAVKSFFITGKTVERNETIKPIGNVKVIVNDVEGTPIDSTYSDDAGFFHVDLDFDKSYQFSASKKGFSWIDTITYSTRTRALGMDSIVLPLWKNAMFAKGIIYSNETQDKLSEAVVTLRNVTDGTVDSMATSQTGTYNFLVKPNKKYVVEATKEGFIAREFELNTAGITQGDLLNDMVLEEVFLEKIIVQFDFEKWDIKPQHYAALDEVARVMKRNKKYHLHIGAYADSHGTHEFNLDLSNKRAREVVLHLESRGIDRGRITATGFGEELLLNQCSNGVICSEEEHAKNRRAELKVQLTK